MNKGFARIISIVLVASMLLLAGPVESLLDIKDGIGSVLATRAEAKGKTEFYLKDFSESTGIEKWYDGKTINGGWRVYNALRIGKISAEKYNGQWCYTFSTDDTLVRVPVSAFEAENAATSFDNINKLLTNPLNNHSSDADMRCMYKCNVSSSKVCKQKYFTWLDFATSFSSHEISLMCHENGNCLFSYYPKIAVAQLLFGIEGDRKAYQGQKLFSDGTYVEGFITYKVRKPNSQKDYLKCLKRDNGKGYSFEAHYPITPQFALLVQNKKGNNYCINNFELDGKGLKTATSKQKLKDGTGILSVAFATVDAFGNLTNPYSFLKNLNSFASKMAFEGQTVDFKNAASSYSGACKITGHGNSRPNEYPCQATAVAPNALNEDGDYFRAKFYLNESPSKSNVAYTVAFSMNDNSIVTSAKAVNSGNYKDNSLTDKKETVSPSLNFSSVQASSTAQSNSTVKSTLKGTINNKNKQKVTSYGFYLKAKSSAFTSADAVGKNNNTTTNSSISVQYNTNNLQPDTLYYYRVFAKTTNNTYYSATKSFRTPKVKPKSTQITSVKTLDYKTNAETTSADLGVGDNIKVKWAKAAYAEYYTLRLNGVEDKTKIYSTEKILKLSTVGQNTIAICAHNSVGSSAWTSDGVAMVHPNVTVQFLNGDDSSGYSEIETKEAVWNHCVETFPVSPSKVGGAFSGWFDQNNDLFTTSTRIKDDQIIKSKYIRNTYKVKFVDGNGNPLAVTLNKGTADEKTVYEQTVYYGESAIAPEENTVPVPAGYHFLGWDADYTKITTSLTITAIADFDNYNIPVLISEASAMRYPTRYVVNCTIKNRLLKDTNGRIIVALKNSAGRLITTTESYAYYIDANQTITNEAALQTETVRVLVPIDTDMEVAGLVADYAEIYLVKDFKSTVPVGEHFTVGIENCDPWSAWSETQTEGYINAGSDRQEHKTQYQYRDLQTTIVSTYAQKTDLVQQGWVWDQSTAKTGTPTKSSWSRTKPAESENRVIKTQTGSEVTGYRYKRYVYKNTSNGLTYLTYGSTWATNQGYSGYWQYLSKSKANALAYYKTYDGNKAYGKAGDFWFAGSCNKNQGKTYNGQDYTIFEVKSNYTEYQAWDYPYTLTRWPDGFSEWSDEAVNEVPGTREINTRELYRYYIGLYEAKADDDTEQLRTDFTSGNIGSEFAGKQAVLFVYKVTEASDWTTEYIAQTVIDENGNYSFDPYILRESPTPSTGDYTVTLAVEGAENQIYLGKIEVPNSEYVYTVTFVDPLNDNAVISEQQVIRGNDATLPEVPEHEGYTFSHWDMRNTNIQASVTINAQYDENEYTVVYYNSQDEVSPITISYVKHGEALTPPEANDTEELEFIGWDILLQGVLTVSSDCVVTAIYKPQTYEVMFGNISDSYLNEGLQVADIQTVEYGETPQAPDVSFNGVELLGWTKGSLAEDPMDLEEIEVTDNLYLSPVYNYENTVATPTASASTGSYSYSPLVVALNCDTDGAEILYTKDGSDPLESETTCVVPPGFRINITSTCTLRFVATHDGMNKSQEASEFFVINSRNEPNKKVVQFGTWDMETRYGVFALETGSIINRESLERPGYTLNGVFRSYELNETTELAEEEDVVSYILPWNLSSDVITEDVSLYLDYSPITYPVQFVDYDGEIIDEQQVVYGESAIDPGVPVREGYKFNGWDSDYSSITEDTIVTATYVLESEYPSITLNRKKYRVMEGSQAILYATIENTDSDCEWISSDASIATVSNGVVDAVNEGTVEISAALPDCGEIASCVVTVVLNTDYSICLKANSSCVERNDPDSERFIIMKGEENGTTVSDCLKEFSNDGLVAVDSNEHQLQSNSVVGTGTKVKLINESVLLDEITIIIVGDLTGDGLVTDSDAAELRAMINNPNDDNEALSLAADFNQDYFIDESDFEAMVGQNPESHTHTYDAGTITKQPTCKEEGIMTYTCTTCDASTMGHTKTEPINKNPANHASYGTVLKNKADATCTDKGYTGDTVCNGCGAIISRGTDVNPIGHSEPDSNGKCIRCGEQIEQSKSHNICKWCGKVHEGFFQKIIGFFHNILAAIFGAKY